MFWIVFGSTENLNEAMGVAEMVLPQATEARAYYRAAKQRYDDAEFLFAAHRETGAVYLAGYTVECFLKALVLNGVARGARKQVLDSFRGSRAHDIEWLGELYRQHVRAGIPGDISLSLMRVSEWSTDLRYATSLKREFDSKEFMESVLKIALWAERRM